MERYKKFFKEENKNDAIKMDKNKLGKIEVYIDKEDNTDYIFGINSGFAYASPMNPKQWIKENPNFMLV
jgi:hypothetical protein